MLVGAARRNEETQRKFQAAMVANLMNLAGRQLRRPITGDHLLGIKPVHAGPSMAEMVPGQREAYIADLIARHEKKKRKHGKQKAQAKTRVRRKTRTRD